MVWEIFQIHDVNLEKHLFTFDTRTLINYQLNSLHFKGTYIQTMFSIYIKFT